MLPVLFIAVMLHGCRKREITPGLPAPSLPKPGATKERARLEGVEMEYKDPQGRLLWTVSAQEGTGEVEAMTATLKKVKCVFYEENRPAWSCRADTLTAAQPTKKVHLMGNVTGQSADGQRSFSAPSVTWDIETARLTGGPKVRFRIGKVELTGDRLIAGTDDKKGRVVGNVQGRILR
ncbi:MAG: LPS export ABC transporter periplasmic protein LptC [Armatimonadetes bacterium]|nr:LPS export ABC transporter periplasmic protein LptC [Armatimonadota bacterium]